MAWGPESPSHPRHREGSGLPTLDGLHWENRRDSGHYLLGACSWVSPRALHPHPREDLLMGLQPAHRGGQSAYQPPRGMHSLVRATTFSSGNSEALTGMGPADSPKGHRRPHVLGP